MARHIMAVCVVCLLCADRIPCQEHFTTTGLNNLPLNENVFQASDTLSLAEMSADNWIDYGSHNSQYNDNKLDNSNFYDKPKSRRKSSDKSHSNNRQKRHAGHDHNHHSSTSIDNRNVHDKPEISTKFLQLIFAQFGHSDGTMDLQGFESMLEKLGLLQLVESKAALNNNNSCVTNQKLISDIKGSHGELSHHPKCSNSSAHCDQITNEDKSQNKATNISTEDIFNLCPLLLYQLVEPTALDKSGCINESIFAEMGYDNSPLLDDTKKDMVYVWIYAFLSVFACGILGLVGVAIIPCMDSRYYKGILQFFVALAVGTMTGDALLHLLPHSVAGQSETNMIYKGLTCMGGIIFFYAMEHGLTMISEWRRSVKKKEKNPSRARVMRDPDSSLNNSVAGDKLCKSKYSSYPYCYDEIAMDTKNDVWMHQANCDKTKNPEKSNCKDVANGGGEINETAQSLLSTNYTPISELGHIPEINTVSTNMDESSIADGGGKDKPLVKNDTVTVILREHESSHHGHSHKHGHVHSPPESLSAVAWMIILGDGLHNFTDGMAIGAAFADNIAGGFSTSLAVFCHELPHELGDFAILMKAGMSVKSAVYYNLLTAVLSFVGMIFGIIFGQSQDAVQWMFAAAAGLFIYIALVDMMPELSTAHKSLQQCCLQIIGMFTGLIIMLFIALYEHDLMNIFYPSGGLAHH